MKRYTHSLLLVILTGSVVFLACHKKKDEQVAPAPDPCAGKATPTATFKAYEAIYDVSTPWPGWIPYDTDTSYWQHMNIEADYHDAATYTWIVKDLASGKTLDSTKGNYRYWFVFPNSRGSNVSLKLQIEYGNTSCFPSTPANDSFTRHLHWADNLLPNGRWQGAMETSTADTFTVTINGSGIHNLPKGCTETGKGVSTYYDGYKQSMSDPSPIATTYLCDPNKKAYNATVMLGVNKNQVIMKYTETDLTTKKDTVRTFKGNRL